MIKAYKYKAILSGRVIEVYQYQNRVLRGYQVKNSPSGRNHEASEDEKVKNRQIVLSRAKKEVTRVINANAWQYEDEDGKKILPKFFTLSFRDNYKEDDIKLANNEFKKFVKRLNYYLYKDKKNRLKYISVIEFQDGKRIKDERDPRGVIHYHIVLFNMPYVPQNVLQDMWENGIVDIRKATDYNDLGSYITKYMTKSSNDTRLKGEKSYFKSRGLKQPIEIFDIKKIEELQFSLSDKLTYINKFENDYLGTIHYYKYNTNTKLQQ